MKYKGAQPPEYIAKPSVEQFKHYQQAARGHIRYVTLAPEHDEGFALTHYLTEHGVVVSIGHSASPTAPTVWWAQPTASAPCTARSSATAATPPLLP